MKGANKIAGGAALGLMLLLGLGSVFGGAPLGSARDAKGAPDAAPQYTIRAVRYATVPKFPLGELVMGAPEDQTIDIAMVFWVIQGGGHTILFDSGYHRETWAKQFTIMDYLAP